MTRRGQESLRLIVPPRRVIAAIAMVGCVAAAGWAAWVVLAGPPPNAVDPELRDAVLEQVSDPSTIRIELVWQDPVSGALCGHLETISVEGEVDGTAFFILPKGGQLLLSPAVFSSSEPVRTDQLEKDRKFVNLVNELCSSKPRLLHRRK